jgi:hypothetical protein
MKGQLKQFGFLTSMTLALAAGAPGIAAAQGAKLYEIVENIDLQKSFAAGARISNWTAQGTADAHTAFCPSDNTCTVTAFGMDSVGQSGTGWVWANIVAVANLDNPTDGPELPIASGQLTGDVTIFNSTGGFTMADLNKNKSVLGPMFPLIYVQNGKFYADADPTVRTEPHQFDATGRPVEPAGNPSHFTSTFRLPFNVGKTGGHERPERGRNAYYLADNGSLIKVDKQDEFALGFPLLRAEVFFE